jgi:hypothetical protein
MSNLLIQCLTLQTNSVQSITYEDYRRAYIRALGLLSKFEANRIDRYTSPGVPDFPSILHIPPTPFSLSFYHYWVCSSEFAVVQTPPTSVWPRLPCHRRSAYFISRLGVPDGLSASETRRSGSCTAPQSLGTTSTRHGPLATHYK